MLRIYSSVNNAAASPCPSNPPCSSSRIIPEISKNRCRRVRLRRRRLRLLPLRASLRSPPTNSICRLRSIYQAGVMMNKTAAPKQKIARIYPSHKVGPDVAVTSVVLVFLPKELSRFQKSLPFQVCMRPHTGSERLLLVSFPRSWSVELFSTILKGSSDEFVKFFKDPVSIGDDSSGDIAESLKPEIFCGNIVVMLGPLWSGSSSAVVVALFMSDTLCKAHSSPFVMHNLSLLHSRLNDERDSLEKLICDFMLLSANKTTCYLRGSQRSNRGSRHGV